MLGTRSGRVLGMYDVGLSLVAPRRRAGGILPGLQNLPLQIDVYGRVLSPVLRYEMRSYASPNLPSIVGPQLVLAGTGADLTAVDSPTESVWAADGGLRFNNGAGKYLWSNTDTASGNIALEDGVIEVWCKRNSSLDFLIGKRASTTTGWSITAGTSGISCGIRSGATSVVLAHPAVVDTWGHFVFGIDRSSATGLFAIRNGVLQVSTVDPSPLAALSLSNADRLYMGALTGSGPLCTGSIAMFSMWLGTDWVDASDKTELRDWALTRYNRAMGI